MVLPCGHDERQMYLYMKRGGRRKFCMACVLEAQPDADMP